MPALKPTGYSGRLTWIGRVADSGVSLRAEALQDAMLTFDGIEGDCHAGATRPSCSRVTAQHPRGTAIRNVRQLSVLSEEEMVEIAAAMKLDQLDPAWLGASLVLAGIPDFTHLPPSSRIQFPSGATIAVDMENRPCVLPGREIDKDASGHGPAFKAAAQGRRGVTAWVEREGPVSLGDTGVLHVPDQRAWTCLDATRA